MSNSLLLLTSNGVGMGHLARQSAIALAAAEDTKVTIMSMSAAIPAIRQLGLDGEYCPGPDRQWQPDSQWPHYVSSRIEALAEEVDADLVSFDGVAPYRGVTLAKRNMPAVPFVWFRRGMWRPGANESQLLKVDLFDCVIEPGDIALAADRGATANLSNVIRVPPVSLYEVIDRLPRDEARSQLGLESDTPAALVTLGAGRLGEVSSPGRTIVETLLANTNWQIAVLTSAIADSEIPEHEDRRVVEVRGVFPLVKYLDAFDSIVSAAGYNAVHEFVPSGLPTLLVPNTATRTDDQTARANYASETGLASVAAGDLGAAVEEFVVLTAPESATIPPRTDLLGGARETARVLNEIANDYQPQPRTLATRIAESRDDLKSSFKRMLGPSGTNVVKRILRRPLTRRGTRLKVTTESSRDGLRQLRFEHDPTIDDLLQPGPLEHILSGSSVSYRSERELIANEHYEVVS